MMLNLVHCQQSQAWSTQGRSFLDYNYRQLWAFGTACAERLSAVSEHVAIVDGDDVQGLADVRVKHVPILGAGVAYVNGGPLVRHGDGRDAERLRLALQALQSEYTGRRGLVLRVAPPVGPPEWNDVVRATFSALGFASVEGAPQYRTLMLNLGRSPTEIRKGLEQKWRNCLNRAERNGLSVRTGTGDESFAQFLELYAELRERKGFEVDLDAAFYARVQRELAPAEKYLVSLAEFEGRYVAGHIGSSVGDTCVYLLGASNHTGLEQKASYLLQWHALSAAQESGCRWYDLGGIDPDRNPGVYHFKAGLGGVEVTAPGAFEFAPAGLSRTIVRGAERVYRWMRRHVPRRARPQKALPGS